MNVSLLLPELILTVGALAVMLWDLWLPAGRKDVLFWLSATICVAQQHLDDCRLARAVRPEQAKDFSLAYLKGHPANRFDLAPPEQAVSIRLRQRI